MPSTTRSGQRRLRLRPGPAAPRAVFCCLLAVGVLVRVWAFGAVPAGLNQDEAFSGYEAWCLLTTGADSFGHPFPVYLTAWGSGMNALQSYLAIPFIALFGLDAAAIRLPQLLCGCAALPVFYLFLRELYGRRTALLGLALLAVCPWHIMACRWALESNLAPFFLLCGLYGLARGTRDGRWYLLGAAAFGLSLYAYALCWLAVPLTLLPALLWLWHSRPAALRSRWLPEAGLLLFLLALPLVLFLLVNRGLLPEVITPFFSIPRLTVLRSGELVPQGLFSPASWGRLLGLLWRQGDGLAWNSTPFGLYYPWSLPFIAAGGVRLVRRGGAAGPTGLLAAAVAGGVLTCLMEADVNVNRANVLHLPLLALCALGMDAVFARRGRLWRAAQGAAAGLVLVSFCLFSRYYFGPYAQRIAPVFQDGTEAAVRYLEQGGYRDVLVEREVNYARLLFYTRTPPAAYRASVQYTNYPAAFLDVAAFGPFTFARGATAPAGHQACLTLAAALDPAGPAQGCTVQVFGSVAVVLPPG